LSTAMTSPLQPPLNFDGGATAELGAHGSFSKMASRVRLSSGGYGGVREANVENNIEKS